MYDKDQIIKEIRRVAKELGDNNLKRSDFISRTLIPEKTVDFYIVSWNDALKEAGLKSGNSKGDEIADNKLLEDLIRLYNQYGEIPTVALINDSGKFPSKEYFQRWRTLEDAFGVAKRKFPDFIDDSEMDILYEEKNSLSDSSIFNLDDTLVSINREDLILTTKDSKATGLKRDNKKKGKKEKRKDADEFDLRFRTDEVSLENLLQEPSLKSKKKKKTIIPKTIKPDLKKKKQESFNFRGLRSVPKRVEDVIFLFGMVSEELSYFIESFPNEDSCYSAKRSTEPMGLKWENVNIEFAVKSSDCRKRESKNSCDLIVCWEHDWNSCHLEILELKSTVKLLDNYSPDKN